MILHALWHDAALHIWAERAYRDPDRGKAPSPGAAGVDGDEHAFYCDADQLHETVGDLAPDRLLAAVADCVHLPLMLPESGGTCAWSVGDRAHGAEQRLHFATHRVMALRFEPADAMDLLTSMVDPSPAVCGPSVLFWRRVADFVRQALRRGQFVPDLVGGGTEGSSAVAIWRVCIRDDDVLRRLEQYAGHMPGVCRAVAGDESIVAYRLVEEFVQQCSDALIRRHLREDPFFERISKRASDEAAAEIHWLAGLVGDRRVMRLEGERLAELSNRIAGWLSRVDGDALEQPPALRIELCEPGHAVPGADPMAESETDGWVLRFALESADESGRVHDAEAILADPDAPVRMLRSTGVNLREHFLSELQRAAGAFAPIHDALRRDHPTHVTLSTVQAHAFLRDAAPLLETENVRVRLPDWARQPSRSPGLRLHLRPVSSGTTAGGPALGLQSIVEFEWRIAVGDRVLSPEQFEALLRSDQPLVQIDGEWIAMDLDRAREAARFVQDRSGGRASLLEALRMTAGADDDLPDIPVVGLSGAGWIEHFLADAPASRVTAIAQPDDFEGQMRPYQLRGLSWLQYLDRMGIGACLADDMGLGKTIQLIALLLVDRRQAADDGEGVGPTLVFAPTSVVGNWQREMQRFAPSLRSVVHHGPQRLSGDAFVEATQDVDVVITTYALGHRDLKLLKRVAWRRIVLDEAQKIKNPGAAQTIAIRSLSVPRRIALTGTPLENHLSELWSIMDVLNRGLLGSAARFRKRFAVPIERYRDSNRATQLRAMVRPFLLRRLKSDPRVDCDLPEKMEMKVFCNLMPEQASLYEQIVADTMEQVQSATGIRRRGVILAALTRLKQACNHPVNLLGGDGPLENRSGKCERLIEMLEEVIAEGDAALVFTQFRRMGDLLERLIQQRFQIEVPYLHGGVPGGRRQELVDGFQGGGVRNPVMLLSLRAGGLGLNLTRANHVFHFDRWWNPAVESQATDRAHRIGQSRKVQVHKFICIGTIEDRIDRMLTDKVALADRVVGSGDEWVTELSTERLREYLTLARDAVG